MNKTRIYLLNFVLLLIVTPLSESIVVLEPIESFKHEAPTHPRTDFYFVRVSDIQFDPRQPLSLNVSTLFAWEEPSMEGVEYNPDPFDQEQIEKFNIRTLESTVEMTDDFITAGYLQSTTESVFIGGNELKLEEAFDEIVERTDYVDVNHYEYRKLIRAILSPNGAYVGGELDFFIIIGSISTASRRWFDFMVPALWDTQTGELIYPDQNLFYSDTLTNWSELRRINYSIEIGFSGDSQFFWMRDSRNDVILFNLNQWEEWQANKDVAFSQDSHFFITERDGQATLIYVSSDTIHAIYQTPSPMKSATFSPDNQQAYLLCEDDIIYVFNSGLSSHHYDWELY